MAAINIQKISGVIRITQDAAAPRTYFGGTGKYIPSPDGNFINLQIENDTYTLAVNNLTVNGNPALTITNAITLLTAIFGT